MQNIYFIYRYFELFDGKYLIINSKSKLMKMLKWN